MGVAAAAPLAAFMPPVGAVGCLWFGLTGGVFPDYADLQSGMKRHLRHRGLSHSLVMLAISTGFVYLILDALNREATGLLQVPETYVHSWTGCWALGILSHLAGDACTRGGIQPFLPFSQRKIWLLPRFARGTSVGRLNLFAKMISQVLIGVSLALFVMVQRGRL